MCDIIIKKPGKLVSPYVKSTMLVFVLQGSKNLILTGGRQHEELNVTEMGAKFDEQ